MADRDRRRTIPRRRLRKRELKRMAQGTKPAPPWREDGARHEARTTVKSGWRKARGPHHREERMAQGTRPVAPWREDGARHEARTTLKSGWHKAPAAPWKSGPSRPASPCEMNRALAP